MFKAIKNFFKKSLLLVNILFLLLLFIAMLSGYFSPEIFALPSFLIIGFLPLYIFQLVFLMVWILRLKWFVIFPIAGLVIGYPVAKLQIQFNTNSAENTKETIHLVSHNLQAFGLNGPQFETNTGKKIFKHYRSVSADIYCFQEFFNTSNFNFRPLDSLKKSIGLKYQHIEFNVHFRGNDFGLATFSKFPIVEKGRVKMNDEGTNMCIYTDLKLPDETIRIYNLHLASVHLSPADYQYIESIKNQDTEQQISGAGNLFKLLSNGFIKRSKQAEAIAEHLAQSPYPVIVCGDFNDVPFSYAYNTIKGDLKDTFTQRGFGLGNTHIGNLPPIRIDYVFTPKNWETVSYKTVEVKLSDHHPISVKLKPNIQ